MTKIPYVGFGNDTLRVQPVLNIGDSINCPKCGGQHTVHGGKDEQGKETNLLLIYNCGEKSYMAGLAGRSVMKAKSDCGGEI